eukprot:m.315831 g.315831  ORF g.315831 m.315831 type:complete len:798 (+) comp20281_c0_seq2:165-2558(+)
MSMSKKSAGITIFARVKPCKRPSKHYSLTETSDGKPKLSFVVPKDEAAGSVNNKREAYNFKFKHIFPQDCSQDDVFNVVAVPVVESVLEGYNGTIFAYGQTGSGKTFTITGGPERYADRGVIPRVLTYLFEKFGNRSDRTFEAQVSYLEIYNDNGYDLLDPKHEVSKMEDLARVELLDAGAGDVFLKNLSKNTVTSEEAALNALFLGDTNRMIAETPMNMASTRSHCVFTIYITSRVGGTGVIRRSKLHLVDLAGSERIGKTGTAGTLATEAKYINLSLHYLEQVIVALSDKARSHIPYRNSLLTSVLRDSLGGNCMTTMIATVNVQRGNIDESISTCRFAQRVAMIQNTATLNEEVDPSVLISRLKAEVERLKAELALATGGVPATEPLPPEEQLQCKAMVQTFVASNDPDAMITIGDLRKIEACFRILKAMATTRVSNEQTSPSSSACPPSSMASTCATQGGANTGFSTQLSTYPPGASTSDEVSQLREVLRQRDNEISILITKLQKERSRTDFQTQSQESGVVPDLHSAPDTANNTYESFHPDNHIRGVPIVPSDATVTAAGNGISQGAQSIRDSDAENDISSDDAGLSGLQKVDVKALFEIFSREYKDNEAILAMKQELKYLCGEAKVVGKQANTCRESINALKTELQRGRLGARVAQLVDAAGSAAVDDADTVLRRDLDSEKHHYKRHLAQLKDLKREIEHYQHILGKAKAKMRLDFDSWLRARDSTAPFVHSAQTPSIPPTTFGFTSAAPTDPGFHGSTQSPPKTGASHAPRDDADDDIAAFFRARDAMKQ